MSNIAEAKRRIKECLETKKSVLDLSKCNITLLEDINEMFECQHIKHLLLEENNIKSIELIHNFPNIKNLSLRGNNISNLTPVKYLENLEILGLSDNEISDLSPLKFLRNLTHLYLSKNEIKNIYEIKDNVELIDLNLEENQIENISAISSLIHLQTLSLCNNKIFDISPLKNLQSLSNLNLDNNNIKYIDSILTLENLRILNLRSNLIEFLPSFEHLLKLTSLVFENNNISRINHFSCSKNIAYLNIKGNKVIDFKPLLKNLDYQKGRIYVVAKGNPYPILNQAVEQGYTALKNYYYTLTKEGKIQNDQLKVILLGNSTAGKSSLLRYWGRKEFSERQTTTHGIATWMDIPLKSDTPEQTFRVNAWDFGGQDYYHATHRLFITPEGTYILVCHQALENRRGEELTNEYMLINGEETPVQVPVQHYPYRFWLETLAFLTKAGSIEATTTQDRSRLPKLFLVENKCGTYQHNKQMRLDEKLTKTLPFEVIGGDFYHLDIREAWRFSTAQDTGRPARRFHDTYDDFEEQLLQTLRAQIENNRYEIHANFPEIRDILARMADDLQNTTVQSELTQLLDSSKIAPVESYEKLPVWISYAQYQDIVQRNSQSKFEDIEGFLHTYLQNLCGRIFHFKDIPALADIVFIDPNWLHQSIYKVLSQEVLDQQGFFTLEDADRVIDGNILEAATFMEVMKAFELVFEVPQQSPRQFVAPQYLPEACPLHTAGLYSFIEENYVLALTLKFSYYLPNSLISRIISKKGHLIKNRQQFLWRNGLLYTDENQVSVFIECKPTERKIEISLNNKDKVQIQETLRKLMELLEKNFSDEIADAYVVLPAIRAKAKWKHLLKSKEGRQNKVKNFEEQGALVDAEPFWFLFQEFERSPINVFVCYSHEDQAEMKAFTTALTKEFKSFEKQHGININPFTDLELKTGDLWHEVLQKNIKNTDLLICLLSPTFFTSEYIQQHEYGQKMKEIAAGNTKAVIAPIFIKPCHVANSNPIANLQFFKPESERFGLGKIENFAFSNLLNKDQTLIHNYVSAFVTDIEAKVLGIWEGR